MINDDKIIINIIIGILDTPISHLSRFYVLNVVCKSPAYGSIK